MAASGPFQACPGLCSLLGLAVPPWYQVPLISVMSGMHHAGVFSAAVSQACQERRPHTLPALPDAGSAALWHLAGWLHVPRSSIPGAPGSSLLQSGARCSPPQRGFGVLAWELGCRVPGLGTQGVMAERLVPAGPGSARGQVLGWLAARVGAAPSLAVDTGLHPSCRLSGLMVRCIVEGVWGTVGSLGWRAGMWSCQQPLLMALLPVLVQELQMPQSTTQHHAGGCWSLSGVWVSG